MMKMNNKNNILVVLMILSFLSVNCFMKEGIEAGEKAVRKFHNQYDNEEFNQIYDDATDEFKNSDSKKNIVEFLEKAREKWGKVKDSRRTSWNINKNLSGTFATVKFKTDFENGEATETFVFLISEKEAILSNYRVKEELKFLDE